MVVTARSRTAFPLAVLLGIPALGFCKADSPQTRNKNHDRKETNSSSDVTHAESPFLIERHTAPSHNSLLSLFTIPPPIGGREAVLRPPDESKPHATLAETPSRPSIAAQGTQTQGGGDR